MEDKERIIKCLEDCAERNDKINKRLVAALIACVVSLSIVIGVVCSFVPWIYFTADYYYPTIEATDSTNTTNTIGGE